MTHTPTEHDRILRAARSHFNIKPHTDDPYYASVFYENGQYWLRLYNDEFDRIYTPIASTEYSATDGLQFLLTHSSDD